VLFHGKRHPADMGPAEITAFLSMLASEGRVTASTQNQAPAALLFLYRAVLDRDVPWLDDLVRAKHPARLPVVLSRDEVAAVLGICTVCRASWGSSSTDRAYACSSARGCA